MYILSPSLLAADFTQIGSQLDILIDNNIKYLHYDIMDGMFVPNISFGMPVLSSIKKKYDLFMDAHMMVEDPIRYIESLKKSGADGATIHIEACKDIYKVISLIHEYDMKAGIALNPGTSIDAIDGILHAVDMVLVMSVCPGFGGQSFVPQTYDRIRNIKDKINAIGKDISIQVDGGISPSNIYDIYKAGADNIVAGSSIFNGNISDNIKAFNNAIEGKER